MSDSSRLVLAAHGASPSSRAFVAAIAGAFVFVSCSSPVVESTTSTEPKLAAAAAQFPRGVREVTDGVYAAVGFGLANSVLVEGEDGAIVIDTLESEEAARDALAAFRSVSSLPIRAIVYTHSHADHVFGAGVFAEGASPDVYAHASFGEEFARFLAVTRRAGFRRAARQFGTTLGAGDKLHCGIGPELRADAKTRSVPLRPTKTFDGDTLDVTVAGLELRFLHLPGETPDHVAVWIPARGVLVSGDNYYHSFPNLYSIRGTPYRDVLAWVASLDRMRELAPRHLVPGHTLPISGEEEIRRRLTDYRDAIQFVHDQTVRAINEGLEPVEIAARLRLPEPLASRPYLAEVYGSVAWASRAIFSGYLGWFGGNASELVALTPPEYAKRLAGLAGGSDELLEQARAAAARGDHRWALALADHLVSLGEHGQAAADIRAAALRALSAQAVSANDRNYLLTQAREADGSIEIEEPDSSRVPDELLASLPVSSFLRAMTVALDPRKAADKDIRVGFRFTDTGEEWGIHVRRGVAALEPRLPVDPTMTITGTTRVWKEVLTRRRNATAAFVSGDLQVDRNRLELVRFLFLFR